MSVEFVGRVFSRMKELGMNPRSVSLASGLNEAAVRELVRKPGLSPKMETVAKLARGLQTTPAWLAYGLGDGESVDAQQNIQSAAVDLDREKQFVLAIYGGVVEAGTFREVGEFEDPDRAPDYVPRDDRFPKAKYFVFEVAGDSMNAADPPMKAGSRVVAVAFAHFHNRLTLQTGAIVVIERTRDDGALRERSIKQLELDETETRFCPRSTNPRHKPIVILKNHDPDETQRVEILGVVIDVINKVRLGF